MIGKNSSIDCGCGLRHKTVEAHTRSVEGSRKGGSIAGLTSRCTREQYAIAGRISGLRQSRKHMAEIGRRGARQPKSVECRAAISAGQRASKKQWRSFAVPSKTQLRAAYLLFSEFPSVIIEAPFGRYRVDIYLPSPYHLGFEVDGNYWHGLPGRQQGYRKRDEHLLREFGLPIVRISETEVDDIYRRAQVGE